MSGDKLGVYTGIEPLMLRQTAERAMGSMVVECLVAGEQHVNNRIAKIGSGPPNASNPLPSEDEARLRPSPWLKPDELFNPN